MKTIYQLLVICIVCFLPTNNYAQFDKIPDPVSKSTGTLIECDCHFQNDLFRFNNKWEQLVELEREYWLRDKETLLKAAIEDRLNKQFSNYTDAQRAFFKRFAAEWGAQSTLNTAQNNIVKKINNNTNGRRGQSLEVSTLQIALSNIQNGVSYNFGDLQTGNHYIRDLNVWGLDSRINTLKSYVVPNQQIAQRLVKIRDGLHKMDNNNSALENRIIDDFMNHYNSFDHENKVRLMTKYLVLQNEGKKLIGDDPYRLDYFPPNLYYIGNLDYTGEAEKIAEGIGANGAIPNIQGFTGEQAILNYTYMQMGSGVYNFINKPDNAEIKLESNNYIKYHTFSQESMDLYKDVIESFANDAKNFPFSKYNFRLDQGSLFTMDFHNENYQTRLVNFHHHNGGSTRKYHGLPNILRQLRFETTTKQQRAFIGGFYLDMVKDNGYDLSSYITAENAFSQFKFRVFDINNLGRYDIEILYTGDTGFMVSRDRIFFPQFLQADELTKEAVKSFFSFDYEKYWHLVRVRDLREKLGLTIDEINWLKNNGEKTKSISKYLESNDSSPLIDQTIKTLIKLESNDTHLIDATQEKEIVRTVTYYNDGVFDSDINFCGCKQTNIDIRKDFLNGKISEQQLFDIYGAQVEFQIQNPDGTFREVSQLDFYLETSTVREGVIREILSWTPVGDISEVGYELYDGNYGMAAANVGLLFVPFDKIIKTGGNIVKIVFKKGDEIVEFTARQMWDLHPFSRGRMIEEALAKTHYKDYLWTVDIPTANGKKNYFWPYFDFIKGNKVVSVKTTNAQSGFGSIKKNIEDLALYVKGSTSNGGVIINDVDLDVWVPEGYDQSLLQDMRNLAESLQINFNILEFK
ncbi:hypothetical protein ABW636_02790 [Aquimarina sp. 2201CG1-2-11]|uniref:hypothetical protein n=1 Tax=Aquimarina discodermiae TaxID=3231043 RepID=UPI0034629302